MGGGAGIDIAPMAAELYPMARWILLSAFTPYTTQSTTRFDQLPSLSFRRGFGVRISASLVRVLRPWPDFLPL